MAEVKSIDKIPKNDETDLTPIEKSTLDTLFPLVKSVTVSGNTTGGNKPVPSQITTSTATPPTPDAVLDTNFTKKALNTVLLTVLFVILYSINVSRVIDMINKKKSTISPTTIFIGKIIVFMIITFLLLYYNP
jgi:flagellar biosynthesis protein FliQ